MKKKKIIIIVLIFIIIMIIGLLTLVLSYKLISSKSNQDNTNIQSNISQGIIEDKDINGLTFTKIQCSYDGTNSSLDYTITNTTEKTYHLDKIEIIIKDKNDNILTKIIPNYDYDLKPQEEFYTNNTTDMNLMNAYQMEINLNYIEEETIE